MIGMDVAISVLGFCGVVTAGILKLVPQRKANGSEKYVTVREFDRFTARIESKIDGLEMLLKSRI